MENMKLPPFYVGQKVVYITGVHHPKNTIFKVLNIVTQKCGCSSIDIGDPFIPSKTFPSDITHVRCSTCRNIYEICYYTVIPSSWYKATSFRAIEERPNYMTFEQIKEKEKEQVLINN